MFYNQQCWFMFIYICIPVYCLYIVYKYLGMTPSGTIVVLLLFFYFPCISLFYSFVCSSHLCILSYMHVPYGAFFINKEFEFVSHHIIYLYKVVPIKFVRLEVSCSYWSKLKYLKNWNNMNQKITERNFTEFEWIKLF